ncbi:MAG: ABC transporter ATP-binding protein [Gammaproteobacteria bacterium]|nr:ABC transporter ATP-binding protein [Gammaproteobacteria bacterium]
MTNTSTPPELVVSHLSKSFSTGDRGSLLVLDDISVTVAAGEVIGVIGPSGCGKSTLLQIIGGLQEPSGGNVSLHGQKILGPSVLVSYVFQEDSLFPWKSALANVMFALQALGVPAPTAREKAETWLNVVGLTDFGAFYPAQLSGGMKQRVALARALATDPRLILMDEPMAALDSEMREKLQNEIASLQHRVGRTTILVSHSLEEVVFLCHRVLILSPRPARIAEVIEIDLPWPRIPELRLTERFLNLRGRLWTTLQAIPGP